MMFSQLILLTGLIQPALVLASGSVHYDYNAASEAGPAHWKDLHYGDGTNNQCGGSNNSPIAVEKAACEVFADYEFKVRKGACLLVCTPLTELVCFASCCFSHS